MKSKVWLAGWLAIVLSGLILIGAWVWRVDPYFHYHAPDTQRYYYRLFNQRSQNDGIAKHFSYDAIITGTSMTENFRTTDMDAFFGVTSIKLPYSGASFKEISQMLETALSTHPQAGIVVRSLDITHLIQSKDYMRWDLGRFPEYLYDSNPFNDVNYLFNRDVVWKRVFRMELARREADFTPGIDSFDSYSVGSYTYGRSKIYPNGISTFGFGEASRLSEESRQTVRENMEQNILAVAKAHPDVTFYCFYPPYSVSWWTRRMADGTYHTLLDAMEYASELLVEQDNIKLFCFNDRLDLLTDLNNYRDRKHYGPWINTLILRWMRDDQGLLTRENYREAIQRQREAMLAFDYLTFNDQPDYEADNYAAALTRQEAFGAQPRKLTLSDMTLSPGAKAAPGHGGEEGILCTGRLERKADDDALPAYLRDETFIGASIQLDHAEDYGYLVFYGKKTAWHGQPFAAAYDAEGQVLSTVSAKAGKLDKEWHMYVLDLTDASGPVRIILNGGSDNKKGDSRSAFLFSDFTLF